MWLVDVDTLADQQKIRKSFFCPKLNGVDTIIRGFCNYFFFGILDAGFQLSQIAWKPIFHMRKYIDELKNLLPKTILNRKFAIKTRFKELSVTQV